MKRMALALLTALMLLALLLPAGAMAQQYTLTLEHQGFDMPKEDVLWEAGTEFTLYSIGIVQKNGKIHARLAEWIEEDIPEDEVPVEIIKSQNSSSQNVTDCKFVMPARNVTFVAQWEDCAVTEYNLYDGAKKGTRFYCKPGEKTPAYDGTPKYRDYVFKGWFPPVKDKADESREYYALWADKSELEAAAPVITVAGREMRFPEDVDRFAGEIWLNGAKLEAGKDYTISEGSTIVTLSENCVETMKNGGHELVASFYGVHDDGQVNQEEILNRVKQVRKTGQGYTVNYQYPVMLYKISNKLNKEEAPTQETYNAGELVTIPMRLGGVYEAVDGKYYEITKWEETYSGNGDPVSTRVMEDKWGNRYISFDMPERDVTMSSVLAERYIVEYRDSVGESQYIECVPGEELPLYSSLGCTPVKEGYAFVGWSVDGENIIELPQKVNKSYVFEAVWKPWEQVLETEETVTVSTDKKGDNVWTPEEGKKGKGVEIHIELEISTFDPEHVYHNGKKLECPRDFTYREGSTIIELTPEYLATLPEGEVVIEAGFVTENEQGSEVIQTVAARFVIGAGAPVTLPQTGDHSVLALWLVTLAAAAAALLLRRRAAT